MGVEPTTASPGLATFRRQGREHRPCWDGSGPAFLWDPHDSPAATGSSPPSPHLLLTPCLQPAGQGSGPAALSPYQFPGRSLGSCVAPKGPGRCLLSRVGQGWQGLAIPLLLLCPASRLAAKVDLGAHFEDLRGQIQRSPCLARALLPAECPCLGHLSVVRGKGQTPQSLRQPTAAMGAPHQIISSSL